MASKEIEKLCAYLSLKEREGPIHKLHEGLKEGGAQKLALCLSGKNLSPDLVNREAFRSVISRIWKLRGSVEIEAITNNIYVFYFQLPEDHWKVMAGGLWSFDDALIVLEEPMGKGAIKGLRFNTVEFLVQISNLSLICMTKEIARFLGSIIGVVREVDTGPSGECFGKFLRVCVVVDIDKPLRQFLRIDVLGDGEETVMPIQYECLPNFNFHCGLIGHTARGCQDVDSQGQLLDKDC
ncbi:hypothetical protein Ddye_005875 [Dipteronia dyeriana]|uniref:DUF4283 domain-containing protein n=1 Tax=Dipteronia dyeriana TaxID=168575 RepID=A0AAD9XHH7_9ROSI|nr:hypothetical protein Ddye_005875 [Dipteronia dyeriana]